MLCETNLRPAMGALRETYGRSWDLLATGLKNMDGWKLWLQRHIANLLQLGVSTLEMRRSWKKTPHESRMLTPFCIVHPTYCNLKTKAWVGIPAGKTKFCWIAKSISIPSCDSFWQRRTHWSVSLNAKNCGSASAFSTKPRWIHALHPEPSASIPLMAPGSKCSLSSMRGWNSMESLWPCCPA